MTAPEEFTLYDPADPPWQAAARNPLTQADDWRTAMHEKRRAAKAAKAAIRDGWQDGGSLQVVGVMTRIATAAWLACNGAGDA